MYMGQAGPYAYFGEPDVPRMANGNGNGESLPLPENPLEAFFRIALPSEITGLPSRRENGVPVYTASSSAPRLQIATDYSWFWIVLLIGGILLLVKSEKR